MATTIWLGRGATQERLDPAVAEAVKQAIVATSATVAKRLEKAARKIGGAAEARWPVGRPTKHTHSKDQLSYGLRLPTRGVLEAFTANAAPWAIYIKTTKNGLGVKGSPKSPVVELVRKPTKKEATRVAEDLAPEIAAQIERLIGGRGGG